MRPPQNRKLSGNVFWQIISNPGGDYQVDVTPFLNLAGNTIALIEAVAQETGVGVQIEKVQDMPAIISYGVFAVAFGAAVAPLIQCDGLLPIAAIVISVALLMVSSDIDICVSFSVLPRGQRDYIAA